MMTVAQAMCRFPVIVSPDLPCGEALGVAAESNSHFMLAVGGDTLIGVARVCDLRKLSPSSRVGRSIRATVVTVSESDPILVAKRMLAVSGGGCLVVVDQRSCLVGMLTRTDLSEVGLLSRERGVDACYACGSVQHVVLPSLDQPALCCECLEAADSMHTEGNLPITLGGGD